MIKNQLKTIAKNIDGILKRPSPNFSKAYQTEDNRVYHVGLFKGEGIGPEIAESVINIYDKLQVPIIWDEYSVNKEPMTDTGDLISEESIESIRANKYVLKGPYNTPLVPGTRSLNDTLRKKLNLFANVRSCKTIEGISGLPFKNVDIVTIRENTEGEFSGLELEVVPGVVEN